MQGVFATFGRRRRSQKSRLSRWPSSRALRCCQTSFAVFEGDGSTNNVGAWRGRISKQLSLPNSRILRQQLCWWPRKQEPETEESLNINDGRRVHGFGKRGQGSSLAFVIYQRNRDSSCSLSHIWWRKGCKRSCDRPTRGHLTRDAESKTRRARQWRSSENRLSDTGLRRKARRDRLTERARRRRVRPDNPDRGEGPERWTTGHQHWEDP